MQTIRLRRMSASRLQTRKRSVAWTLEKLLKNFAEIEPLKGIEPLTSSLPRKCSTTELQRRCSVMGLIPGPSGNVGIHGLLPGTAMSGRRGSNSPPIAWKAIALPNELLPLLQMWKWGKLEMWKYTYLILLFPEKSLNLRNTHFHIFHIITFPHFLVGKDGFEPPNSEEDRFTVCCRWPLGYLPGLFERP
jgi:hypothetical protein